MKEYKIVVLGPGAVGKSAITLRLVNGDFQEVYDPTVEDTYKTTTKVDDKVVPLDILDTAGQDQFNAMREIYMQEGEGFLLIYSIISANTFQEIETFHESCMRVKEAEWVPTVLIGNKCDLEDQREVTSAEGEALAKSWTVPFFETSAKENTNISEVFHKVVQEIWKEEKEAAEPEKKKGGCTIL